MSQTLIQRENQCDNSDQFEILMLQAKSFNSSMEQSQEDNSDQQSQRREKQGESYQTQNGQKNLENNIIQKTQVQQQQRNNTLKQNTITTQLKQNLQTINQKLKQTIKQKQEIEIKYKLDIENLSKKLRQSQIKIQQLQQKIITLTKWQNNIRVKLLQFQQNLDKDKQNLNRSIQDIIDDCLIGSYQEIGQEIYKLYSFITGKQLYFNSQSTIEQCLRYIKFIKCSIIKNNDKVINLTDQIIQLEIKNKKLEKDYYNKQKYLNQSQQSLLYHQSLAQQILIYKTFPGSNILHNIPNKNSLYLLNKIQNYTSRFVKESKLLYRYDGINFTNLHQYLDNKNNLLLVLKLKNNHIIGGYIENPINTYNCGKSFLYSINPTKDIEQFYPIIEQKSHPTIYDENYIIFGNNQIKIRTNINYIYSDFGSKNSYYNYGQKTLLDFFGMNHCQLESKTIQLENYQFYEILFDD